jgi:hypothetical protein
MQQVSGTYLHWDFKGNKGRVCGAEVEEVLWKLTTENIP